MLFPKAQMVPPDFHSLWLDASFLSFVYIGAIAIFVEMIQVVAIFQISPNIISAPHAAHAEKMKAAAIPRKIEVVGRIREALRDKG